MEDKNQDKQGTGRIKIPLDVINQPRKSNSRKNGGIVSSGGLIEALKNPDEAELRRIACGLMLKDNYLPEIFSIYNSEKERFEIPGGKIDPDDRYPKGTVVREFSEELGITIEIDDNFEAKYKFKVNNEYRIFKVYFCRYDPKTLPSKPKEDKFPYWGFIPILGHNTRNDISPLIDMICEDIIPLIKEERIDLAALYKKSE